MNRLEHAHLASVARALRTVADALEAIARDVPDPQPVAPQVDADAPWNARLWSVPVETRLNAEQAAEALGVSMHAMYKLTSGKRVPHRRLNGRLTFTAGDLRQYIRDFEVIGIGTISSRRAG